MKKIVIILGVCIAVLLLVWLAWAKFFNKAEPVQNEQTQNQTTSTFEKSLFFIHHSTGEIYWNGGMEKALTDVGYNVAAPAWEGGTDPKDFYNELSNPTNFQKLENYSIIVFKSCFPSSDITSDAMLTEYKNYYNQLYEVYRAHPDKLFVPMSTPPLLQNHTTAQAAKRALDFEEWLLGEYKSAYDGKNLVPFGLHSLLSDNAGYLKSEFIASTEDDHPNNYSGQVVGKAIVEHLSSRVK